MFAFTEATQQPWEECSGIRGADDAKQRERALADENRALLEQRHATGKVLAVADTKTAQYLASIKVREDNRKAVKGIYLNIISVFK